MKTKIKVTMEYMGSFRTAHSQDYKVLKIVGAPTVEVETGNGYGTVRVGDIISEAQAAELAKRVEITTVPRH